MASGLVIVGLGNPGSRYDNTPHSVGFEVVDALAAKWSAAPWAAWKRKAAITRCTVAARPVLLAKPGTFVNLSGEVVRPLLAYHGADPADLLCVCDDIALPLGRTRLRPDGSSGGQKGLQNIIDHLGTAQFARLRIGVAPGEDGLPCAAERWVLSRWSPTHRVHLDAVLDQAVACVEMMMSEGLEEARNRFNGQRVPDPAVPPEETPGEPGTSRPEPR